MTEKKRKFVPSFVIEGDGPTFTDPDEQVHELQPDSVVRFRCDYPWALMLLDAGTMAPAEYVREVCRLLRRQIVEWNWTDTDGNPYPQPDDEAGFNAAIVDLRQEERSWLLNRCWEKSTEVPNE